MLLVSGTGGGTTLTGTVFERGERPPSYDGAPEPTAPYVWICDSFYRVESGGSPIEIDGEEIRIAFEPPTQQGFPTREAAIDAGIEHVRTQFARIGVEEVAIDVRKESSIDSGNRSGGVLERG